MAHFERKGTLKFGREDVDSLNRMIQAKLIDCTTIEIAREDAFEFLPYQHLFMSPVLRTPVEALLCHRGKIVPVLGPLPAPEALTRSAAERPWILLLKGYAQVVLGLPNFEDERHSQEAVPLPGSQESANALLSELDELMKAA